MLEGRHTWTHPPGGLPDPPFWLVVVLVQALWLSPMDCSSALVTSEKVTDSLMSIAPEMAKCLVFVAVEASASSAALHEQHWDWHCSNSPVFGICCATMPWDTRAELEKTWVLAAPPAGGRVPEPMSHPQSRSSKLSGVRLTDCWARFLAWTYPNFYLIDPFSQMTHPRRAPKTMNLADFCILLIVNYFIFRWLTQAFIQSKVTNFSNKWQGYFLSYVPDLWLT